VPGNPAWTRLEETMPADFDKRWRRGLLGSRPRRPRIRLGGCLLWLLGLLIILVILSLLFGGFQKGTKVHGTRLPVPFSVSSAG
jgi:hypothetical protein